MSKEIIPILQQGGIGVLPTDTIYGLAGQALNPDTVERIYQVRQRRPDKPLIILISGFSDLKQFNIKLAAKEQKLLSNYWPGPVSIILPCPAEKFAYLHRGLKTLAFRWPNQPALLELLKQTGPLVAPSANPEGQAPASNIATAQNYFGHSVDFYADAGELVGRPSALVEFSGCQMKVLRPGLLPPKE